MGEDMRKKRREEETRGEERGCDAETKPRWSDGMLVD